LKAAQFAKVIIDDDSDGQLSDELTMHTTVRIARALNLYQRAKMTICRVPLVTTTSSSVVDNFSTATDIRVVIVRWQCLHTSRQSADTDPICRFWLHVGLQLQSIRWSPTSEATRQLVQAVVMCRLET